MTGGEQGGIRTERREVLAASSVVFAAALRDKAEVVAHEGIGGSVGRERPEDGGGGSEVAIEDGELGRQELGVAAGARRERLADGGASIDDTPR